ncbi:MAG: hypothetical protein KGM15_01475 [Pseudomonadota bacterium]|nr:hypothetical protein [Pseudomonadota bacterium]
MSALPCPVGPHQGSAARTAGFALALGVATAQAEALKPIAPSDICVTNGELTPRPGGRLGVDSASSRAVLTSIGPQAAEIRFTFLGVSARTKPLASGELRQQIGLKLRAADTCNLIYAMWHIAPDSRVAVSVKRNPGQSTHQQCGAHGYDNLKASEPGSPPPITRGSSHVLRAELRGSTLTVSADGALAWRGDLGAKIAGLDGPVGLRTDNARFVFTYFAAKSSGAPIRPCARTAGD